MSFSIIVSNEVRFPEDGSADVYNQSNLMAADEFKNLGFKDEEGDQQNKNTKNGG